MMGCELETLKDLEECDLESCRDNGDLKEFTKDLRTAAIKHIKSLNKEMKGGRQFLKNNKNNFDKIKNGCMYKISVVNIHNHLIIDWITHFFNITEEELK